MPPTPPHKLLIFIVTFNARDTLTAVLDRIVLPDDRGVEAEVLVIDDSSADDTFEVGVRYRTSSGLPIKVLCNPVNQGYGGNQKLGYEYAIRHGFDSVVLLHGDGQYPPELLPELVRPLCDGDADAVFGSRMLERGAARKGGMPLYKVIGNRILTGLQNWLLRTRLSEFHSGYRAYRAQALERIPFRCNTNEFHFDTEIIIQLLRRGYRIGEIPIPTYYGDEICHVNGLVYAWNVVKTTVLSRLQGLGILYQRKFDVGQPESAYEFKRGFRSSHSIAIEAVGEGESVLDLGCGAGYVAAELRRTRGCHVTGIDRAESGDPQLRRQRMDRFIPHDLNAGDLPAELVERYDTVLMLDVIEHLRSPEEFMQRLRLRFGSTRPRLVITTANVAFLPIRLGLLLGQFNYGKRGILDLTHTRLFTFGTLKALLVQAGYDVRRVRGIPAPFPLVFGRGILGRSLSWLNSVAIAILPRLFSYQIYVEVDILPTVDALLDETITTSEAARTRLTDSDD